MSGLPFGAWGASCCELYQSWLQVAMHRSQKCLVDLIKKPPKLSVYLSFAPSLLGHTCQKSATSTFLFSALRPFFSQTFHDALTLHVAKSPAR